MPEDAPPPSQASKDCIDAIVIPPQLPNILKLYTKAAMRTQPKDLLRWTYSYMKAMRDGKKPPVKDRGEAEPVERAPSGLTPGFLRVLDMMLRGRGRVTAANVREAWEDLSFNPNDIRDVLQRAELVGDAANDWQRVLVVFANTIPAGRVSFPSCNHSHFNIVVNALVDLKLMFLSVVCESECGSNYANRV